MHRKTGVVEPVRYVCAHDCGLIVNPETLSHVIERQLVYGTGRATVEELPLGRPTASRASIGRAIPFCTCRHVPAKIEPVHLITARRPHPRARRRWRWASCRRQWATRCSTRRACGCAACRSPRSGCERPLRTGVAREMAQCFLGSAERASTVDDPFAPAAPRLTCFPCPWSARRRSWRSRPAPRRDLKAPCHPYRATVEDEERRSVPDTRSRDRGLVHRFQSSNHYQAA